MFGRKAPSVLVAGAGPVGLFTALTLARRGVAVQIVDKEWRPAGHSYALALHARSLELLEEVGLLGPVLDEAYRVRTVGLYEGGARRAEVRLSDLGEDFSFVAVMRQDRLEQLLVDALAAEGVKVKWNHELGSLLQEDDHVEVTVNKIEKESLGYGVAHSEWVVARTKRLSVPFVIGADGHRSDVRRALGIGFEEAGPAQHFAVFEFKTDADLHHEMRLVLNESTTNLVWPLPEGYCRWSFELLETDAPVASRTKDRFVIQLGGASYPVLTEAHLHELLAERAPWFEGSIEDLRWRLVVRFERRLADVFGRGRVWLAGDAAHMTGPAGIQSMNVGLREARDLAEVVADVLAGTAAPAMLEAYDAARRAEWRFLLGLDGALRPGPETDAWVAARADRLLAALPASAEDLARLAGQLGLEAEIGAVAG